MSATVLVERSVLWEYVRVVCVCVCVEQTKQLHLKRYTFTKQLNLVLNEVII